mmetsp:Transcript_7721/g.23199  ORF Transcript_7721/g.23199 Transcript_7721/m.23199 type:complete len:304 (+) Transcript_7721:199-1110(+)
MRRLATGQALQPSPATAGGPPPRTVDLWQLCPHGGRGLLGLRGRHDGRVVAAGGARRRRGLAPNQLVDRPEVRLRRRDDDVGGGAGARVGCDGGLAPLESLGVDELGRAVGALAVDSAVVSREGRVGRLVPGQARVADLARRDVQVDGGERVVARPARATVDLGHVVLLELDGPADDAQDGLEGCVDGAGSDGGDGVLCAGADLVQPHRRRRGDLVAVVLRVGLHRAREQLPRLLLHRLVHHNAEQRLEVGVRDDLLRVGDRLRLLDELRQLGLVLGDVVVPELDQPRAEGGLARMLAQHQHV